MRSEVSPDRWGFTETEKEIWTLQGLTGFENALAFEADGSTPTRAVCIARQGQKIIGVDGAAGSLADGVWEAGVDVQEEYRGAGLGSCLTGRLTEAPHMRNW